MHYYRIVSSDRELLAIYKSVLGLSENWLQVNKHVGEIWLWYHIGRAEFETYQAFGIKEIKL